MQQRLEEDKEPVPKVTLLSKKINPKWLTLQSKVLTINQARPSVGRRWGGVLQDLKRAENHTLPAQRQKEIKIIYTSVARVGLNFKCHNSPAIPCPRDIFIPKVHINNKGSNTFI
jgi:hypothetical protein